MKLHSSNRIAALTSGAMLCLVVASADAQTPDTASTHAQHVASTPSAAATETTQTQQDLSRLSDQMRQLDQRMQASAPAKMPAGGAMAPPAKAAMATGRMAKMEDDMAMPKPSMNSASSMPKPAAGMGMGMMQMMESMHPKMGDGGMMGMGAMGGMNSPAAMATPSALPGFPGQSHVYHIGATDFFLDHPQHIALTTQQQQTLALQKQQSLLKQSELQKQIDAAEQELWLLTGADQPQIADIEKKAREIERLRGDQRVAFIRAVGEAGKVLTDEQRKQLTGLAPAASMADPASMPMPDNNMPKPDSMGDM